MLIFNYGSPYFWDKVVLTKFISGCRMVWDLICGTSWFYKSKTEKVTGGGKSAILPNWCCLLSITVLFTHPCHNHNIQLKWALTDIYEPIFMLMGLKICFCVHISVSWANWYAKLVKLHFASLIKKHVIMHNMVH